MSARVVTRTAAAIAPAAAVPERGEMGPSVTDPAVRRGTLAESTEILNTRPLVKANDPLIGIRSSDERPDISRTDCGWIC